VRVLKIIVAKNIGFCPGVRRAVNGAFAAASENGREKNSAGTFALGEIIHNAEVVRRLSEEGVRIVGGAEDVAAGGTVIIRAHGVAPNVLSALKERRARIVDCTCAYVKKIHDIARRKYAEGYDIIIAGEKGHPEVEGINGCAEGNAEIAEDYESVIRRIEERRAENMSVRFCLVFQTTFNYEKYYDIIKKLEKDNVKTLEIFDTICYTTMARQKEAAKIARKCDAVLVVGDKKSSNTRRLFEIASAFSKNVLLISELSDLSKVDKNIENLGIVTGASTSDELIMEVIFTMSNAQQSGVAEAVNAASDKKIESAILNNDGNATAQKPAPKKAPAKTGTPKNEGASDGLDTKKKTAADPEKKAAIAEKKAAEAAKKAALAEKKVLEAEKKAAEAERKAEEAERKAEEAEKKTDIIEIRARIASEKIKAAEKKAVEDAKAAAIKAEAEKATETAGAYSADTEKAEGNGAVTEIITVEAVFEKAGADNAAAEIKTAESSEQADGKNAGAEEQTIGEINAVSTEQTGDSVADIKTDGAANAEAGVKAASEVAEKAQKTAAPAVKPRQAPVKRAEAAEEKITMEDVLASKNSSFVYKAGKKVTATIINAGENGVDVAIGGKKDGFIDKSEMNIDGSYDPSSYKIGDVVDAVIIENPNKGGSYINLSKKQIDIIRENDKVCAEILKGAEFKMVCDKIAKGGITGKYGSYTVFVPASQIRIGFVKNPEEFLGKPLRLKALPPKDKEADAVVSENAAADGATDENAAVRTDERALTRNKTHTGKFIVASQRVILEKERREKEDEFWNSIRVGDVVRGKVKRFVPFGAFVSVNGFDCLVHISDLSWSRVEDPSRVLKIDETYEFVVLKTERETNKISLGYKQLQKRPYDLAQEKFPVGSIVRGRVERIKEFGAFVSIDEGVDGLVHVSQISHDWIKNANEVLKVGDMVSAKVMSFDENRITLSIKELTEKPEYPEEFYEERADGEPQESREKRFKKREAARRDRTETVTQDGSFDRRTVGPDRPRRDRRPRQNEGFGQSEWVASSTATTSLGDLFKGIKLDVDSNE
jgi:4-hydroxy-3-methylbut-2-enyl diphosphate reductase